MHTKIFSIHIGSIVIRLLKTILKSDIILYIDIQARDNFQSTNKTSCFNRNLCLYPSVFTAIAIINFFLFVGAQFNLTRLRIISIKSCSLCMIISTNLGGSYVFCTFWLRKSAQFHMTRLTVISCQRFSVCNVVSIVLVGYGLDTREWSP